MIDKPREKSANDNLKLKRHTRNHEIKKKR